MLKQCCSGCESSDLSCMHVGSKGTESLKYNQRAAFGTGCCLPNP